jgi:hypothetical protein
MKEEFRDIKGFEEMYQVSNLGRVKSLARKGVANERILNGGINTGGYRQVSLLINNTHKNFRVHQLVAMSFLNHKPNGFKMVVNHIDFNKLNNNLNNLEVVTFRENANKKHLKSTSKYVGVSWCKRANKWRVKIQIIGKHKHLGFFKNEKIASAVYQSKLETL